MRGPTPPIIRSRGRTCSRPAICAAALAVWAIREGRLRAQAINEFLMDTTNLPS
jgi:NADPH-dependent glutamate synthase beta subunit-like oxidoreductase